MAPQRRSAGRSSQSSSLPLRVLATCRRVMVCMVCDRHAGSIRPHSPEHEIRRYAEMRRHCGRVKVRTFNLWGPMETSWRQKRSAVLNGVTLFTAKVFQSVLGLSNFSHSFALWHVDPPKGFDRRHWNIDSYPTRVSYAIRSILALVRSSIMKEAID